MSNFKQIKTSELKPGDLVKEYHEDSILFLLKIKRSYIPHLGQAIELNFLEHPDDWFYFPENKKFFKLKLCSSSKLNN